jgi:K+ transporter
MPNSEPAVEVEEADMASKYTATDPPSYDRRAPKLSPMRTAAFAFSCLGVIYSDIGTSPLYVLSTIFPSSNGAPNKDEVIGIISAIIWSFTLLPLLKYVSHTASLLPVS